MIRQVCRALHPLSTRTHANASRPIMCILPTVYAVYAVPAEVVLAKAHLNEIKAKSRMLQQEKRNLYDQISAADDLKKQQQVPQAMGHL